MWEVRRSSPAPMQLRVSILKPKFGSPLTSRRCICSTRSQETGCPMALQFPRSVKIFLKSEPVWALCASGGSLDILPRGSVTTESPHALTVFFQVEVIPDRPVFSASEGIAFAQSPDALLRSDPSADKLSPESSARSNC